MKKKSLPIAIIIAFCIYGLIHFSPSHTYHFLTHHVPSNPSISKAFQHHLSNIHVTGSGRVIKILGDDTHGSRHQRFILRLSSGQTVLIAHNIDLAPRIKDLKPGDIVEFSGEYVWNAKGGIIHWTHHDPSGHHRNGWLKHNGRNYD